MFWLIGTAFAFRNFLTLTTLWGFSRVFRENSDLLVFGEVWALREIPGLHRQNNSTQKIGKKVEIFSLRFVLSSKPERSFFVFGPWCPL